MFSVVTHTNARKPDNTAKMNDSFFIIFNVFNIQNINVEMNLL